MLLKLLLTAIRIFASFLETLGMSRKMQVPLSQQRHSNVAVVRYCNHGKRLEVACYKNKVVAFRNGTESSLNDVLQIDRVFTDVARGDYASAELIQQVLGKPMTDSEAILFILQHGKMQVSQGEREGELDDIIKEVCTIVAEKCVNSQTGRPYPVELYVNTVKSLGFSFKFDQPAKKQALQVIHDLLERQPFPLKRAPMLVRCSPSTVDVVREWMKSVAGVEEAPEQESGSLTLLIEPGLFRELDIVCRDAEGAVQVIQAAVMITTMGGAEDILVEDSTKEHQPLRPPAAGPTRTAKPKKEKEKEKEKEVEEEGQKPKRRAKKPREPKPILPAEPSESTTLSDEEMLMSKKERSKRLATVKPAVRDSNSENENEEGEESD